ncbi:gamma-glutamylcyclotransferase [Sneathiella marina]|uniref:glutathione-specific gamma-glutamylcyclotransferase n=1 Tax=Sneathiella marina TaxID=2950108 RepID=A0ABY4W5T7_9PROT|nr:gamma-glutamylcyclotransferase [Sneathiella marina]USG61075.1 gamma-glutamylcyclotransferase [Sneathiella marina]
MTRSYDLVLEPDLPPVDFPLPDLPKNEDLWIFGYGSLMWRPGFEHLGVQDAQLFGYHRAFCVSSVVHRGTREKPGLVLGLDRGGSCKGKGILCPAAIREPVIDYLYRREMVTRVYVPKMVRIKTGSGGEMVPALTFVADPAHEQYCGKPTVEDAARIIAGAHGRGGPNRDYLASTLEHLDDFGIADGPLHQIMTLIDRME